MNLLIISFFLLVANSGTEQPVTHSIWPVRIEIRENEVNRLAAAPREPVRATVQFGTREPAPTRLKLKGQGSFQPIHDKPSFTLEFDRHIASRLPFGADKI